MVMVIGVIIVWHHRWPPTNVRRLVPVHHGHHHVIAATHMSQGFLQAYLPGIGMASRYHGGLVVMVVGPFGLPAHRSSGSVVVMVMMMAFPVVTMASVAFTAVVPVLLLLLLKLLVLHVRRSLDLAGIETHGQIFGRTVEAIGFLGGGSIVTDALLHVARFVDAGRIVRMIGLIVLQQFFFVLVGRRVPLAEHVVR